MNTRKWHNIFLFMAVTALGAGCAGTGGPGVARETASLGGVIIHSPEGSRWRMTSRDPNQVTFTRKTDQGREHSVTAFAELYGRPETVTDGRSLLKYALMTTQAGYRDKRYTPRKNSAWLETGNYGERVVVKFAVEDRGVPWNPGKVYIMSGEDIYFLHPDGKNIILMGESQRFPEGATPLDLTLELAPFMITSGTL